jgi:hypothetical protein
MTIQLASKNFQFWKQIAGRQIKVASQSVVGERTFHFASNDYTKCFYNLPQPDMDALRNSSRVYLQSFDPQTWYNDPVRKFNIFFLYPLLIHGFLE